MVFLLMSRKSYFTHSFPSFSGLFCHFHSVLWNTSFHFDNIQFMFSFVACANLRNHGLTQDHEDLHLCSFSCFIVLCLRCLGLWSILSGILPMVRQKDPASIFCVWISSCPSTVCHKNYAISIEQSRYSCEKSIDYKYISSSSLYTFHFTC